MTSIDDWRDGKAPGQEHPMTKTQTYSAEDFREAAIVVGKLIEAVEHEHSNGHRADSEWEETKRKLQLRVAALRIAERVMTPGFMENAPMAGRKFGEFPTGKMIEDAIRAALTEDKPS